MEPRKPDDVAPFAAEFLKRLQDRPEADQFILGGYFALKHYLDYRQTGDVDAWWRTREDPRALTAAREAFNETAASFGYTAREREWGETVSLDAVDTKGNQVFSFQVAVRTVQIDEPIISPWGRLRIETIDDNIASKMQALVARGAPRDFVDIKRVVDAGLVSVARCWELWAAKDPRIDVEAARLRVRAHLERIETRMPLDRLPTERRTAAAELRTWYRETFVVPRTGLRGNNGSDGEGRNP